MGRELLSGGNDGRVILQSWPDKVEGPFPQEWHATDDEPNQKDLTLLHGRKVNHLASRGSHIFVADISKQISMYAIR